MNQNYVVSQIGGGGAFLHFSGHGSPGAWLDKTFPEGEYTIGLDNYHMPLLKNDGMYPVTIIGGCHNSLFNTTLVDCVTEVVQWLVKEVIMGERFQTWYRLIIAECFGWRIVRQPGGGAIASLGCTGLGYGASGDRDQDGIPDCIEYNLGWAEVKFADVYASGVTVLGNTHVAVLNEYINTFEVDTDRIDRKTVEEWVLLGDPTLAVGGYA
jgi:hypothetical protein